MPILLKTVRIAGFRGLRNIQVDLDQRTVLIGTNNVGKTTFLNALQLALGDSRWVSQDDFSITNGEVCSEIVVDLLFVPADEHGKRTGSFSPEWRAVFRKDIAVDEDGDYFAFRTRVSSDGGDTSMRLAPLRKTISDWPVWDETDSWIITASLGSPLPLSGISESIPLFFQNAQRDILEDIRQRTSFLGRALAKIKYTQEDRDLLQTALEALNQKAIETSPVLVSLRDNLADLGTTFGAAHGAADVTPFPKDVRDLAKGVRMHFSEGSDSFAMEYHGMGTRSWASLLSLKAFVNILIGDAGGAYHPILALEEPEAHLHPNAQKQIMGQINSFPGQAVVSTHSPYIASQADLASLRCLFRGREQTAVGTIPIEWDAESLRRVQREIVHSRGDALFSRAWVLIEGETEAQAVPLFFKHVFGKESFELGVNLIGVGGSGNFPPFIRMAESMNIPWYVLADGEPQTVSGLTSALTKVFSRQASLSEFDNIYVIEGGLDYESLLLHENFKDDVQRAIAKVFDPQYFTQFVQRLNGKPGKKGRIRDYSGAGGEVNALKDILTDYKAQLAEPVALEIIGSATNDGNPLPGIIQSLLDRLHSDLEGEAV